jgi:hypothetical protein
LPTPQPFLLTTESEHVKESEGMGNKGGLGLVGLFFPDVSTLPFTLIALDFIIKVSLSEGFNSILTITDTFTDYHVSSQIDTPHFLATIIQELCCISKCTNQKMEQYLSIFVNYNQTSWQKWLPLAKYMFNAWPYATIKKAPFELIMGHILCIHR